MICGRTVDVCRARDDLRELRTVLHLVEVKTLARCSAFRTAFTVLGFFVANSSVNAQTFSGWSVHICCVVMAVKPMLSAIARTFHGSPTQKPSILSTFMLATICGGGIVMRLTSLSGLMPPDPSQ